MPHSNRAPAGPPRPVKSRAAHFTHCPPKPFEARVGLLLSRMHLGANQAFGAAVDKSPAWVSRVKDPGDPTHIRASDVANVCQALGTVDPINELFRGVRIMGFEWHMQPVPEVAPAGDVELDSMEMMGQAGAFIAALGRALADRELSRAERAELRPLLDELGEQIDALKAGLGLTTPRTPPRHAAGLALGPCSGMESPDWRFATQEQGRGASIHAPGPDPMLSDGSGRGRGWGASTRCG